MSRRKLKPRVVKQTMETLSVLTQMQELVTQLEDFKKVNEALMEGVGSTLKEHHDEIEVLKRALSELKDRETAK